MTEPQALNLDRISQIFFPYAAGRGIRAQEQGDRFVYYTTAAVAAQAIQNRQFWLRNALLMNDFSEIGYGYACLTGAYRGAAGVRLKAALEQCSPGLAAQLEATFDGVLPAIRSDTYISCLSEHLGHEDQRGRLSMWRAYGGTTGVALVIKGHALRLESNALGTTSYPVMYADANQFASYFMQVAEGIEREVAFLRTLGPDYVGSILLQVLRFAVLCTKHPGFAEELEWRVVASPSLHAPARLHAETEIVRDVPQRVLKVTLENAPEEGLVGLALPDLIDRVIVGPCAFPEVTAMTLSGLLAEAGVPDAAQKVVISDIPLRHDA